MLVSEATKRAAHRHEPELSRLPNVNGVGHGKKIVGGEMTDRDAVMVLVEKKLPIEPRFIKRLFRGGLNPRHAVPAFVDGIETDVVYAKKLEAQFEPTEENRPAPPGSSLGHKDITAGTLGLWVRHIATGKLAALTNNHVGANMNDAEIGDPWYQPGPYDGGGPANTLCKLADFVPIIFSSGNCPIAGFVCSALNTLARLFGRKSRLVIQQAAANEVDCSIGFPLDENDVRFDVPIIGRPEPELAEATIGMKVQKFGRTTLHTTGTIIALDATVQVSYGEKGTATFEHQIVIASDTSGKPFSAGGDSGSSVWDMLRKFIGELFGGSTEVTIVNEGKRVLAAQEVALV